MGINLTSKKIKIIVPNCELDDIAYIGGLELDYPIVLRLLEKCRRLDPPFWTMIVLDERTKVDAAIILDSLLAELGIYKEMRLKYGEDDAKIYDHLINNGII